MKCAVMAFCLIAFTPSYSSAQNQVSEAVQLKHMLVPVQTKQGSFTTSLRAITPILTVQNVVNAPGVCQRMPRVTEALLKYFSKFPIPVGKNRRIDVNALEDHQSKMVAYVNRALGAKAVSEVYIIEGGRALNTGVAARLPGGSAANACGAVLEEYEKQLKAREKIK